MLNSGNNGFYGVFMPLHHSLGFPSVIFEGGSFDPQDPLDPPLCVRVYVRVCAYMHVFVCVCVCVRACVFVCACVLGLAIKLLCCDTYIHQ